MANRHNILANTQDSRVSDHGWWGAIIINLQQSQIDAWVCFDQAGRKLDAFWQADSHRTPMGYYMIVCQDQTPLPHDSRTCTSAAILHDNQAVPDA
jgi:hypothetical protein